MTHDDAMVDAVRDADEQTRRALLILGLLTRVWEDEVATGDLFTKLDEDPLVRQAFADPPITHEEIALALGEVVAFYTKEVATAAMEAHAVRSRAAQQTRQTRRATEVLRARKEQRGDE